MGGVVCGQRMRSCPRKGNLNVFFSNIVFEVFEFVGLFLSVHGRRL